MIPRTNKEDNDEEPSKTSTHISVLGKTEKDANAIEYQDLKNIFLEQRTIQKILNQNKRRYLKKHFLKESKQSDTSKLERRRTENIIVNFYFFTKLS